MLPQPHRQLGISRAEWIDFIRRVPAWLARNDYYTRPTELIPPHNRRRFNCRDCGAPVWKRSKRCRACDSARKRK